MTLILNEIEHPFICLSVWAFISVKCFYLLFIFYCILSYVTDLWNFFYRLDTNALLIYGLQIFIFQFQDSSFHLLNSVLSNQKL